MSKTPRIVAALFVIALMLAVAAVTVGYMQRSTIEQPVAFNHRLHLEDVEMDCTDCHLYAETGVRATIPNVEVCSDCHDEAMTESAEEARLMAHIASGERIPWQKVYRVPAHVYFSHRRHTAMGGIECATCHGAMEEQAQPVTRPAVRITMDRCMGCHEESRVSNDCLLCHR